MMRGPCMCGDTQCPSCGRMQGTYRAPRFKRAKLPVTPAELPALICCQCGTRSTALECPNCNHEHAQCCAGASTP